MTIRQSADEAIFIHPIASNFKNIIHDGFSLYVDIGDTPASPTVKSA
jgi:hypothetical protein